MDKYKKNISIIYLLDWLICVNLVDMEVYFDLNGLIYLYDLMGNLYSLFHFLHIEYFLSGFSFNLIWDSFILIIFFIGCY